MLVSAEDGELKKSNIIVLAIFVACSVALLALWYFLGFHRIDSPLDLIVTIVWWAVIALAAFLIARAEKTRCRHIRTVYVSDTHLFNSELGLVELTEGQKLQDALADMIEQLEYSFHSCDFPSDDHFKPRFMVRTFNHKPARSQQQENGGMLAADDMADLAPAAASGFGGMATSALDGTAGNGGATVYGAVAATRGGNGFGAGGTTAGGERRQEQWEGEVVMARGGGSTSFDTPERLHQILRTLHRYAG